MLFNSGTTSLLSFCRDLMDDPSTAPRQMFSDATIKSFLNVAYQTMREDARFVGQGATLKTAYDTAADGTAEYDKPADFIRLRSAEIDLDGGDLSALAPNAARIVVLDEKDYVQAWQSYQLESLTNIETISVKDDKLVILAPPDATAAGTNSIRFVYEAATADMTGDTDEPEFSRSYHHVIARLAAMELMATKNLDNRTLTQRAMMEYEKFQQAATEEVWGPNIQFWVAGLDDQDSHVQTSGGIDW